MAGTLKIIGGNAAPQRVPIGSKWRVRGLGVIRVADDVEDIRLITQEGRTVTFEISLRTGERLIATTDGRGFAQLSQLVSKSSEPQRDDTSQGPRSRNSTTGCVGCGAVTVVVVVTFLLIVGMLPSQPAGKAKPGPTGNLRRPSTPYVVISEERRPPIKASFDVRLPKRVTATELESIAREIRSKERESYERMFIVYYLPGMQVDAGAWATTHWNPNLEVRILGMTDEREAGLLEEPEPDDGATLIGTWIDDSAFVASVIRLKKRDGAIEMHQQFKDGSKHTVSATLIDERYDIGRREYLRINSRGDLEWYDEGGLIVTCKKVP